MKKLQIDYNDRMSFAKDFSEKCEERENYSQAEFIIILNELIKIRPHIFSDKEEKFTVPYDDLRSLIISCLKAIDPGSELLIYGSLVRFKENRLSGYKTIDLNLLNISESESQAIEVLGNIYKTIFSRECVRFE